MTSLQSMRLNKYLASSGIAARRKCEDIIRSGRVVVNNVVEKNPFRLLALDDRVLLDDQVITRLEKVEVIVLNKPIGYITTVDDPQGRKTVMDLVKTDKRLFPIGRLDKDTTGVLLITNDGDLANQLTHPKFRVEKVYRVQIEGTLSKEDINQIRRGVIIGEGEIGKGEVLSQRIIDNGCIEVKIVLTQGKKREVRRIFSSLKFKVLSLERISFGGITSKGLKPGQWRRLSQGEVEILQSHKYTFSTLV